MQEGEIMNIEFPEGYTKEELLSNLDSIENIIFEYADFTNKDVTCEYETLKDLIYRIKIAK